MRKTVVGAVVAAAMVGPAGESAVAQGAGQPGGCAAFGVNVASLATSLGAGFGGAASDAATAGPRVFATAVVGTEQAALCGDQ